jgi:hypothetical protein
VGLEITHAPPEPPPKVLAVKYLDEYGDSAIFTTIGGSLIIDIDTETVIVSEEDVAALLAALASLTNLDTP